MTPLVPKLKSVFLHHRCLFSTQVLIQNTEEKEKYEWTKDIIILSQSAVAFGERRWAGYPLRFMSVCWSYSQWISGFVPRAFGSGSRSWLSSALLHWTAVQSIHPCCRPWMGCLRVLHLETLMLYWDFNGHMGNNSWRGVNERHSLPDLFCYWTSVQTTEKHVCVHKCTWHQNTLGHRSIISCVIVSSDVLPYVLDT